MQTPTIGRIVHFLIPDGAKNAGEARPAIIVKVWDPENPESKVQLQVFMDGNGGHYNDGTMNVVWHTSVEQSEGPEPGKFHFPQIPANKPDEQEAPKAERELSAKEKKAAKKAAAETENAGESQEANGQAPVTEDPVT